MNFEKGKTEVVLMFRRPGSNQQRTLTFDKPTQPSLVIATPSHTLTLRIVAAYKHLGARFAMDADLHQEIQQRSASARQAFEELKRPIFQNRAIDVKGRQQLYQSLVASRLFYGSAIWSDVSSAQVQQTEALLIGHHRRIHDEGFWKDEKMTDSEFVAMSQMMTFRTMWARNRLVYLQAVSRHGHDFYIDMLLDEFQRNRGWLWEVRTDLQLMQKLVEIPFQIPVTRDAWQQCFGVLASYKPWKTLIARACQRHRIQEQVATEVGMQHNAILQLLRDHGCEVVMPTAEAIHEEQQHGCW